MHYFDGSLIFGMHLFWWIFWIVVIVALFTLTTPVPRHKARATPLKRLQLRYANGEISTQEYEERKKNLEQDAAMK